MIVVVDQIHPTSSLALRFAHRAQETWGPLPLITWLRQGPEASHLPIAWSAHLGTQFIGGVALLDDDLPYMNLNPWLGFLFVEPAWRHHGVATMLGTAALQHAVSVGLNELYLFCEPGLAKLYERFGFAAVGDSMERGKPVVVMKWVSRQNA